jgi:hypothetical protein
MQHCPTPRLRFRIFFRKCQNSEFFARVTKNLFLSITYRETKQVKNITYNTSFVRNYFCDCYYLKNTNYSFFLTTLNCLFQTNRICFVFYFIVPFQNSRKKLIDTPPSPHRSDFSPSPRLFPVCILHPL